MIVSLIHVLVAAWANASGCFPLSVSFSGLPQRRWRAASRSAPATLGHSRPGKVSFASPSHASSLYSTDSFDIPSSRKQSKVWEMELQKWILVCNARCCFFACTPQVELTLQSGGSCSFARKLQVEFWLYKLSLCFNLVTSENFPSRQVLALPKSEFE